METQARMETQERIEQDGQQPEEIEVVGAHEIRDLVKGLSRQRVYQLTRRSDFPRPVAELAQGKVWLADEVQEWIVDHRKPRK